MEAIYTQLLAAGAAAPAAAKGRTASRQEEGSFQRLLMQQARPQADPAGEETGPAALDAGGAAAPLSVKEWEQQLALAAAAAQSPQGQILTAQTAQTPPDAVPAAAPQEISLADAAVPQTQTAPDLPQAAREETGSPQAGFPAAQTPVQETASPRQDARIQSGQAAQQPPQGQTVSAASDRARADTVSLQGYPAAERPVFQRVEHIPVQVGEVTAPAGQTAPPPVEIQTAQALAQAIEQGESRVHIQLQPESLGRLEVELTWSREGALRVSITPESSRTQSLLERASDSLRLLLTRSDRPEVYVEVRRQEESQGRPFYQDQGRQDQPQRQYQHQERQRRGEDFLQQLRLGLIPLEGEAS